MSSKLTVQQAYGLNSFTKNTITSLDDRNIIYLCGNQIVSLNIETKDQTFLHVTPNSSSNNTINVPQINGISAIAVSQKKFIAVAEKGDSYSTSPSIAFYDIATHKKKRILSFPDLSAQSEICSMAFCHDGHLFITQSKYPDGSLTLWSNEKSSRILSSIKTVLTEDINIHQISFCPYDSNIVLVLGKGILKLYRIVEGQFRPVTLNTRREVISYTSHCWLNSETMILGSEAGEIFLIENLEYRGVIYPDPFVATNIPGASAGGGGGVSAGGVGRSSSTNVNNFTASMSSHSLHSSVSHNNNPAIAAVDIEKGLPVYSLVATSKGGFISGHVNGEIMTFEKQTVNANAATAAASTMNTNFSSSYQIEKRVQLPSKKGIIHSFNILNDEYLILTTDTHQLLNFSLSSLDQAKENQIFEPLLTFFHEPCEDSDDASIVSICTSLWKPYIVFTVGKDRTLKLWHIQEKKLELSAKLEEEPNLMSVHPTGMYVAIASDSKIKVYTVLKDSISMVSQLPIRACTALAYSHGGQFICAASGSTIHIFDSLTANPVGALRGHTNRIKNVVWQEYDASLISFGYEGSIFFWNVLPSEKRPEHFMNTVSTLAGVGTKDGSYAFCTNIDNQLKKLCFNKGVGSVSSSSSSNNDANNLSLNENSLTGMSMTSTGLMTTKKDALNSHVSQISTLDLKRDANIMIIDEMHGMLIIGASAPHAPMIYSSSSVPGTANTTMSVKDTSFNNTASTANSNIDNFINAAMDDSKLRKTNVGAIVRIPYYFDAIPNYAPDISTLHASNITALCLSPDGNYLYSGDETGCLFVSAYEILTNTLEVKPGGVVNSNAGVVGVTNIVNRTNMSNNENNVNFQFTEEVMVRLTDIDKFNTEINKLNTEIAEVTNSNNQQMKAKELENDKAINKLRERFSIQIKDENDQYQNVVSNKNNLVKGLKDEYIAFDMKASEETANIDKKYQYKLGVENTRLENLKNEMDKLEKKWKDESQKLIKSHESYINDITEENESLLQEENTTKESLIEEKVFLTNTSKERGLLIKSDVDNEINQMKAMFDIRIKHEDNIVSELLARHGNIKKELATITTELDRHKEEVMRMKEKETRLIENIKTLEKDMQQQKKDIREREDAIADKDKRMIELKKKNQELEKFRFVLDYKIKELKLQIAPSEQEIFSMRKQLEEMTTELNQYKKSNQALSVMINELKLKIHGLKHEVDNENIKINENNFIIESVHRDLKHLSDILEKDDTNALKQIVINLFRDYVQSFEDTKEELHGTVASNGPAAGTSGGMSQTKVFIDPEKTYNRDREQMERNIVSLARLVKSGTGAYKRDVRRKLQDNKELLEELEMLKKDMELIQQQKEHIDQIIQQNGGEKLSPEDLQHLLELLGLDHKAYKTSTKITDTGNRGIRKQETATYGSMSSRSLGSNTDHDCEGKGGVTGGSASGFLPDINMKQASINSRSYTATTEPIKKNVNDDTSSNHGYDNSWEIIKQQTETMVQLEAEITRYCTVLNMDPKALINEIDSKLVLG